MKRTYCANTVKKDKAQWKQNRHSASSFCHFVYKITILRKGKDPLLVSSYRPINSLPLVSKLLKRSLLIPLSPSKWIPSHQFEFRERHGSAHQIHCVISTIRNAFHNKQYCSARWSYVKDDSPFAASISHSSLCFRYLADRTFVVSVGSAVSPVCHMSGDGSPPRKCNRPFIESVVHKRSAK